MLRCTCYIYISTGVTFKPGNGDECAAALALVLFGHTDTILPGGYAGEEISIDSPIIQIVEFPAELVLLGRATVMIKGIANRLGISWGLSDRWAKLAQEALGSMDTPTSLMPVWSVSPPTIPSPSAIVTRMSGKLRFKDVTKGFVNWLALLQSYLSKKTVSIATKVLPRPFLRFILVVMAWCSGLTGSPSRKEKNSSQ